MDTGPLKTFAQNARCRLMDEVSARLDLVLTADSVELREKENTINELKKEIATSSKDVVVEKVAYTWFNRFCALRFMDVNKYTGIGVISPSKGNTQPEILLDAKQGHIAKEYEAFVDSGVVFKILSGQQPSSEPQVESYRMLLKAVCNYYYATMPFLFQKIDDYTELLMPADLLSENSILQDVRETLTPEVCQDVEVIGWLYQYYISEKKDEVFAGLKKNKKITPDNIPAATQLFTPHWIVRYLAENSLGRLWMLNNHTSSLIDQMEYYIKPEQEETDYLKVSSPEEIKICDPACGSGHMLTYAFDLMYAIYEEEGYQSNEIPKLILENNLYGIEIDERAGELAAFALTMKAREKYRRFLEKPVQPNICVLENIAFKEDELEAYMDAIGRDLFTSDLQTTLQQFKDADNYGSLIQPAVKDVTEIRTMLEQKEIGSDLFLSTIHPKVLTVLKQADYLSQKYHVVIANPPYMGGKGMNTELKEYAKLMFPDSKSDLFAMFIERGFDLVKSQGFSAMVTMQSWMFLSSYEKLRTKILDDYTIECMAHMANMVMGIAFGTAATVWRKKHIPEYRGAFCYVEYSDIGEDNKPVDFPPKNERNMQAARMANK